MNILVGKRIAHLRKSLNLTQKTLAARAGCSRSYLARVEVGIQSPSLQLVEAVANAFDVPLAFLFIQPEEP